MTQIAAVTLEQPLRNLPSEVVFSLTVAPEGFVRIVDIADRATLWLTVEDDELGAHVEPFFDQIAELESVLDFDIKATKTYTEAQWKKVRS